MQTWSENHMIQTGEHCCWFTSCRHMQVMNLEEIMNFISQREMLKYFDLSQINILQ